MIYVVRLAKDAPMSERLEGVLRVALIGKEVRYVDTLPEFKALTAVGTRGAFLFAVSLPESGFSVKWTELMSVLAENVFSYPGLGSAVSAAGLNSDVPLLLGITLFSTLFVCVGNLIANLLYGVIDPQIREVRK